MFFGFPSLAADCPASYRQLAKKKDRHADEIEFTPYMFASSGSKTEKGIVEPGCGECHPGGGMLEYDRDGQRYDEPARREPELVRSLDGDYYNSNWDKFGEVEIDCFFCHLPKYSFGGRNRQLKYQNFRGEIVTDLFGPEGNPVTVL